MTIEEINSPLFKKFQEHLKTRKLIGRAEELWKDFSAGAWACIHLLCPQGPDVYVANAVFGDTPNGNPTHPDAKIREPRFTSTTYKPGNRQAYVPGCEHCGGCGYEVLPHNGMYQGVRCRKGCPVVCSVCNDPNCDNPGGQH